MEWDWSMVGELLFVIGLGLLAMGAIRGYLENQKGGKR